MPSKHILWAGGRPDEPAPTHWLVDAHPDLRAEMGTQNRLVIALMLMEHAMHLGRE